MHFKIKFRPLAELDQTRPALSCKFSDPTRPDSRVGSRVVQLCDIDNHEIHKKLRCRREIARCFVSLNILLVTRDHSRSFHSIT